MVLPGPADQASGLCPAWVLLRDSQLVPSQTRAKPVLKADFSPVHHLAVVTFLCMLTFALICKKYLLILFIERLWDDLRCRN